MNFEGRAAIVTGGGQGIGHAICVQLAREGADVAFTYRSNDGAAADTVSSIESHGRRALAVRADMGDADAVRGFVTTAQATLGPITLLVNNAAYMHLLDVDDLTFDRWQRFMRVNVDAAYLTTWAVKDDMIAAGGGAIVNISSLASRSPKPDTVGYAASKSALEGFSRGCAAAFVRYGIRVNTVVPGLVLTPRAATVGVDVVREMTADVPMQRAGDPAEIAATVCFLLSDAGGYITGEAIVASGGQH